MRMPLKELLETEGGRKVDEEERPTFTSGIHSFCLLVTFFLILNILSFRTLRVVCIHEM